jgi:hypothetical protein
MSEDIIHNCISYLGTIYFKLCIWASGIKIDVYGIENIEKCAFSMEQKIDHAIRSRVSWRSFLVYVTLFSTILGALYTAQIVAQRDIQEIDKISAILENTQKNNELLKDVTKSLIEVVREKNKNNKN